jgi:hypothetical protein
MSMTSAPANLDNYSDRIHGDLAEPIDVPSRRFARVSVANRHGVSI